jgi:integrase
MSNGVKMVQRKKSGHGSGSIQERKLKDGSTSYKLRYYVDSKRHSKAFRGTKGEARKELRRLMKSADDGEHFAINRLTLDEWVTRWYALKERSGPNVKSQGKKINGQVSPRTLERYQELMRLHVLPTLGKKALQRLKVSEIDDLYIKLEAALSPRTIRHIHIVLNSCLSTAVRKGIIPKNPAEHADLPIVKESTVGRSLEQNELTALLQAFRGTSLFLIVTVAAGTGMRRNEILALEWKDIDFDAATMTVSVQ